MTEVIAGRADFFFGPVALVLPHIRDGKLAALAVNTDKRSAALPQVPTTPKRVQRRRISDLVRPVRAGRDAARDRRAASSRNREFHCGRPRSEEKLAALGVDPMPMPPAQNSPRTSSARWAQRGAGAEGGPEGRVTLAEAAPRFDGSAAYERCMGWAARSRRCSSTGSTRHDARAGSMSAAARAFSRRRWSSFALRQVSTASTRGGASQRRRARAGAKPRAIPGRGRAQASVCGRLVRRGGLRARHQLHRGAPAPWPRCAASRAPQASSPLRLGLRRGALSERAAAARDAPRCRRAGIPGTGSRLEALRALFLEAGLEQIETRTVDVCLAYADFTDFWESQTPDYQPTTKIIAQMKPSERTRLMHAVQAALPAGPNGSIEYCARANAIKARVPR